eukprot:scaffold90883_cov30-Tisochrysis_lutea.AAC.4
MASACHNGGARGGGHPWRGSLGPARGCALVRHGPRTLLCGRPLSQLGAPVPSHPPVIPTSCGTPPFLPVHWKLHNGQPSASPTDTPSPHHYPSHLLARPQ